jgi:hypothetical protein
MDAPRSLPPRSAPTPCVPHPTLRLSPPGPPPAPRLLRPAGARAARGGAARAAGPKSSGSGDAVEVLRRENELLKSTISEAKGSIGKLEGDLKDLKVRPGGGGGGG